MRGRIVVQPDAGMDFPTVVVLNLLGGPLCAPLPPLDGLVSPSFNVRRSPLETMGRIKVPETCRAVLFGSGDTIYDIGPGVHSLHFCTPGPLYGRLVDTTARRLCVRMSGLSTADLGRVTVEVQVQYQVCDPVAIVTALHEPIETLRSALAGAVREQIRLMPHASLFGTRAGADLMAGARLERYVRQSLRANETLDAFRIWAVTVISLEGDTDYLELAKRVEVARLQLLAEGTELEVQQLLVEKERLLAVTRTQAERERRLIEEQISLDRAQVQAQVFDCQGPARAYEVDRENRHMANDQAMERLRALGQTGQALATPYPGAMANAPFAYAANSPGRDQALLHVVDRLADSSPNPDAGSTNGKASQ